MACKKCKDSTFVKDSPQDLHVPIGVVPRERGMIGHVHLARTKGKELSGALRNPVSQQKCTQVDARHGGQPATQTHKLYSEFSESAGLADLGEYKYSLVVGHSG